MDKILDFARKVIKEKIEKEQSQKAFIAVDGTCGRGNDTLFLVQNAKEVYAFDIQDEAIKSTKELLKEYQNVHVIHDSHRNIDNYVKSIDIMMFNLGYLPKADKRITTHIEDVLVALKKSMELLSPKGIITICVYPGHEEGMKESIELGKYLKTINQKEFDIVKYEFINQINYPPYLYIIQKLK